ncbi:MAG: hypothetical protein PHN39_02115 [Candidatus Pacebacteria bacterium]|nr:hypothetical protein [Candidatus Paceibacterota bacterium]
MPINKIDSNYISLTEASVASGYSQEYLSLRARQRKLRAVKIGRNWVTTQEWLDNYLKQVEVSKNHTIVIHPFVQERALRQTIDSLADKQLSGGLIKQKTVKIALRPKHYVLSSKIIAKSLPLLVVILLILVFYQLWPNFEILKGKAADSFLTLKQRFTFSAQSSKESPKVGLGDYLSIASEKDAWSGFSLNVKKVCNTAKQRIFEKLQSVEGVDITGRRVSQTLLTIKDALWGLRNIYLTVVGNIKKGGEGFWFHLMSGGRVSEQGITKTNQSVPKYRDGLIVIPSGGEQTDTAIKEKIKLSFSDEVLVEPEDDNSGIITPVFKNKAGDHYLYMMVPTKN